MMVSKIRNALKAVVPRTLLELRTRALLIRRRNTYSRLAIAEAFGMIYKQRLWGCDNGFFSSGSGSIGAPADEYVNYVRQFIATQGIKSIVDLGCGDFRIGSHIARSVDRYIGIDVVPELIVHLSEKYGNTNTEFRCTDATQDHLPAADCCLIRQVLQHLSNAEIQCVLSKLTRYAYVLITEHYPPITHRFKPNLDKPHGPDIRAADESAVVLDQPPFNEPNVQEVLRVNLGRDGTNVDGTVRTFLLTGR